MEHIIKQYTIDSKKIPEDKRIVTISDLHFNTSATKEQLEELVLKINDLFPNYIFILGDLFTYNNLEDKSFRENILYFFKLLSAIGKSYLVFGNNDYLLNSEEKNFFVHVDKLINFYQNTGIKVLSNCLVRDEDFDIVGFNKFPGNYHYEFKDISKLREEIEGLLEKIKSLLDQERFTIMLTHSHLDILKLQAELLKSFDLILAGHTHNGLVPNQLENIFPKNTGIITAKKLFQRNVRGGFTENNQPIIVNGGITKISDSHSKVIKRLTKSLFPGEIDLIKINKAN